MLGCELLLALAQRERLGRLNEPAGAVREFLEIHNVSLGLPLRPCGTKVHPTKPINRERSMAPTPNGGRQILCGNSRFAAEEPVADFRARPRQAAAWRLTSLRMSAEIPRIHAHLPLSGEGPFPRGAHGDQACGRRDAAGRPALCHREWALGLRPRRPALPAQAALSDAHAQRAAGEVAHPLSRTRTTRWRSNWTAAKPRAATCIQRTAARRSSASSPTSAPTSFAGRRACCTRRASASPTLRARSCRSSIWRPWPRSKSGGDAGASAALSRQSLRDGLAGLARVRSGRAGDRDRQGGAAQDRQADRALCRDRRRSRHRHP